MCQYRFIDYNKCTILMGGFDGGEGCACIGQGNIETPHTFCSILLCTKNCSKKSSLLKQKKIRQCWKQCPAHISHSMNTSYDCSIITIIIVLPLSWPTGGYISGKLLPRAVLGTYRWHLLLLAISRTSLAEVKAVAPLECSSEAPPTCCQSAMLVFLHSSFIMLHCMVCPASPCTHLFSQKM